MGSVWTIHVTEGEARKKDTTPELSENRRAKVRCFAGISKEATIVADEEAMNVHNGTDKTRNF